MSDPSAAIEDSLNTLLHAWVADYCATRPVHVRSLSSDDLESVASQFERHAERLRESAQVLESALVRMRAANERLAARMVEHRAFFEKYQQPG